MLSAIFSEMKRFHCVLAQLALSAFTGTGLYMHFVHDHLRTTDVAIKAFWRSRHIYLLLIGITLLMLAAYVRPHPRFCWMQYTASTIYGLSTIAIAIAFFVEVDQPTLRSPLSAWAIQALIPATLMHLYVGWQASRSISP